MKLCRKLSEMPACEMKLVFYSPILNNHQANVADELWKLTEHRYRFVELADMSGENRKGDTRNYDDCPYLIRAWESEKSYNTAMELARTAECCVFSGVEALPFQRERLKRGLLSFDMSERWLKRGLLNLLSPVIFKMFLAYHMGRWRRHPVYKLCCSAFAATDQNRLGTYRDRCYKWGYFTQVDDVALGRNSEVFHRQEGGVPRVMWCSRYLAWKHPELPVLMAHRLKHAGYQFHLDMYGSGKLKERAVRLVQQMGVSDVVSTHGSVPNVELLSEMRRHDIFILTSDRHEGWGAVANESMSNGCVLVASDTIGSVPYLLRNGMNGFTFPAPGTISSFYRPDEVSLESLCSKVAWLLEHPDEMYRMRRQAVEHMQSLWSPSTAAKRLLSLVDCLQNDRPTPFVDGPCSMA